MREEGKKESGRQGDRNRLGERRGEEAKKGRGEVLQRLEGDKTIEYCDRYQRGQRGGSTEIRRRQKQ